MGADDATAADAFIAAAVRRGRAEGPAALSAVERTLFLIAAAEADCDMEGVDALLDRFRPPAVRAMADAFTAVGAVAIGRALTAVAARLPARPEKLLDAADELIKARDGYDDQSLREYVAPHLPGYQPPTPVDGDDYDDPTRDRDPEPEPPSP